MTSTTDALHAKYRPATLDQMIGHVEVAGKFQRMIQSNQWPSAILFTGPPSAGKTTMARALACSALGVNTVTGGSHPCVTEIVGTSERSIDDIRNLVMISKQRPNMGTRRFIIIDEAQGLLGNPAAAAAVLGALEDTPKSTTWLLSSMEPEKFQQSKNGRAMFSRCVVYKLPAPTDKNLFDYGFRIINGEGIKGRFTKEVLATCVQECGGEYRRLAHILQDLSLVDVAEGQKLSVDDVESTIVNGGSEASFDAAVLAYIKAIYANDGAKARTAVAPHHKEAYRFLSAALMFHGNAMIAHHGGSAPVFGITKDLCALLMGGAAAVAPRLHYQLVRLRTDPTVTGQEVHYLMTLPEQLGN